MPRAGLAAGPDTTDEVLLTLVVERGCNALRSLIRLHNHNIVGGRYKHLWCIFRIGLLRLGCRPESIVRDLKWLSLCVKA